MSRRAQPEMRAPAFVDELEGAAWLERRLGRHGPLLVLSGITDRQTRRDRLREAITKRGLEAVICDAVANKCLTYAAAFERVYGEKL